MAPTFRDQPGLLRQQFWAFGLLKLLRPRGLFALHAAGVVTERGQGLLIVGASGSGKSILTLGVMQHGWYHYYDNFCLPHVTLGLPLSQPEPTKGTGSVRSASNSCLTAWLPIVLRRNRT